MSKNRTVRKQHDSLSLDCHISAKERDRGLNDFSCNQIFVLFPNMQDSFIHSFIHSGHFYSAPSSPLLLRGAPDYSMDTVWEFHAEAHTQL